MVCFDGGCFERNEVPAVFYEPYIKGGYRAPDQPYHYYLRSLFFYHNEIINMWTALLTVLMHIYLFKFCPALDVLWMLNFAGMFIHICSFVAHTVSHHSPRVHIAGYLLDYLGIYAGCAQVMPAFLVLQLNISLSWAMVYGAMILLWHGVVFRNCCAMFFFCWRPWLTGGSEDMAKPRVLTFVVKSVWPFAVFWLIMNFRMCFDLYSSTAANTTSLSSLSPPTSFWLHILSLSALVFECFFLKSRYPECALPDYFQSFRSHPITHLCAATVTLGLVGAFICDRSHDVTSTRTKPLQLESDWPITVLSIFNMLFCATVAAKTLVKIISTQ